MINARSWFFRGLVLVAIGLFLTSWFMPWWGASIKQVGSWEQIVIRPWGLQNNMPDFTPYIKGAAMPAYFAPLMWSYLGLVIIALFSSLFVKNKILKLWKIRMTLPSLIIGIVGISYILVVALAAIVISIRAGDYYDTRLMGVSHFVLQASEPRMESDVNSVLHLGYWLAGGVGVLCIVLAVIRGRIMGNSK